jgi:hypothetical protein
MCKRLRIGCALIAAGLLGANAPAHADDNFRCANETVHLGEPEQAVLRKCGPPSEARRVDHDYRTKWGHARVVFDVWTYNRGPYEFTRTLTFEREVLRAIDVGGYGN